MKSLFHAAHKLYHWIHRKIWGDTTCSMDLINNVIEFNNLEKPPEAKNSLTPAELFDECENPIILNNPQKND